MGENEGDTMSLDYSSYAFLGLLSGSRSGGSMEYF